MAPTTNEKIYRQLYLPAYSVREAARYAAVAPGTIAAWYAIDTDLPLLTQRPRGSGISYLNLVEIAFVGTFRRLGVSLRTIRLARAYLAQRFGAEFPFSGLRFYSEGHQLLVELAAVEPDEAPDVLIALSGGQLAWNNDVLARFDQFDYDEQGIARPWWPAGRDSLVKIDPYVAFGAPAVNGVPTWIIRGRQEAGEPVEDIMEDFNLDSDSVRAALTFEEREVLAA